LASPLSHSPLELECRHLVSTRHRFVICYYAQRILL